MEYDKMLTFQDWHDKTEEILALQAKWKTIGFAPQKMNTKIFERFRSGCDDFFKEFMFAEITTVSGIITESGNIQFFAFQNDVTDFSLRTKFHRF